MIQIIKQELNCRVIWSNNIILEQDAQTNQICPSNKKMVQSFVGEIFMDGINLKLWEEKRRPFEKIGHERGMLAENIVERVFNDRFQTGDVPKWLTGYERATVEDDSRGIDGWFYTDVGKIPLQIKSSRTGKKHAAEKKPNIPTAIVRAGDSEKTIFSQCISAIGPERKKYLKERQIEE